LANTPASVVVARQQEQVGLVPGQLLVIATDPIDRQAVAKVLGATLDQAHEREHPEQIERGKHGERERGERVAAGRQLAEEAERHQRAGDRSDVQGGARGALAHRLRSGALEREVLGRQRRQELPAIGRVGHAPKPRQVVGRRRNGAPLSRVARR
jgi:hypothetical protein